MTNPRGRLLPAALATAHAATLSGSAAGAEPAADRRGGCSMYSIAHRGEHKRHDENTIGAITAVRRSEVDLRVTRDDRLILMHDQRLDRTTDGSGLVHRRPWRYIRSLHTEPHGGRVPTWEQVLDVVERERLRLVVEIKNYNAYWSRPLLRQMAGQVREHGLVDRLHFGGYGVLPEMAQVTPRLRTYWHPGRDDRVSASEIERRSANAVIVLPRDITTEMVRRVNRGGFPLWAAAGSARRACPTPSTGPGSSARGCRAPTPTTRPASAGGAMADRRRRDCRVAQTRRRHAGDSADFRHSAMRERPGGAT